MSNRKTTKAHNLPAPANARYRIELVPHPSRGRYVVIDHDGRWVGAITTKDAAESRAQRLNDEADVVARRGPRPCITCGATFLSEGIHNRMCKPCRGIRDPLGAYGLIGAQDGRKSSIRGKT